MSADSSTGSAYSPTACISPALSHRWLCEVDPWRRDILRLRFPGVPIYEDVHEVGAHNAEPVHVLAGGFPCKGASTAGPRTGFDHPETVLWREMARTIRELRPRYVLVENVANLLAVRDGAVWGEVLGDLAAGGFDVVWDCYPAAAFGAPHLRDRVIAIATHADRTDERWDPDYGCEPDGRQDARGDRGATSDAGGDGVRQQPVPERRGEGAPVPALAGTSPADPDGPREDAYATPGAPRRAARERARGVAVEWGEFQPAIDRWAAIVGDPPEPLVRRMDDRGARRVDRSRLSGLGDGVQVQLGRMAGEYLMAATQRKEDLA